MASGQTTNFGLNQWAAEDQVLREEFNENNAKVDATLSELKERNKLIKLGELIVQTPSNQVNISLAGYDLRKFSMLRIIVSGSTTGDGMRMRLNNISSDDYYSTSNTISSQQNDIQVCPTCNNGLGAMVEVIPFNSGNYTGILIHAAALHPFLTHFVSSGVCTSIPFFQLTELNFLSAMEGYLISANSRFDIYGYLI